jgi:hypothetical protein
MTKLPTYVYHVAAKYSIFLLVEALLLSYRRTRLDWAERGIAGQALVSIRFAVGKRFINVASVFSLNLSSPSSIATCTVLHAIRRFRRQHCGRSSDPEKFTFLLAFSEFFLWFRKILNGKGLFQVTSKCKHLPYII